MGAVAGLLLGAGLLCVWWSFWPRREPTPSAWGNRTRDGVPLIEVTAEDRAMWAEAGLGEMRCDHRHLG